MKRKKHQNEAKKSMTKRESLIICAGSLCECGARGDKSLLSAKTKKAITTHVVIALFWLITLIMIQMPLFLRKGGQYAM